MKSFEFFSVPRIVFGPGQLDRLTELCGVLGRRPLLVSNVDAPRAGGLTDKVSHLLAAAGLAATVVVLRQEPEIADVERSLATAREAGCDMLIGLGGGSAIDLAKAVAGLLSNGGSPLDYMEVIGAGRRLTRPAAPWVAVPTTAGTGAEVTRNAVIASREKRYKASIRSEHLLARVVLVDGELGRSVPPEITAYSGMDALCQLIESYVSRRANAMTDALILPGLSLAAGALPRAWADGQDIQARCDMALAAMWSGLALANAGLGAAHGLAAPLGANFPAPHGAICAALLPHVMAANAKALHAQAQDHPVLGRLAVVGRALTQQSRLDDSQAVQAGIEFVAGLCRRLGVPPLRQFGLSQECVPVMVPLAQQASSMKGNPVELSATALTEILQAAI
jgi:alcohol dehydrogenase class IV